MLYYFSDNYSLMVISNKYKNQKVLLKLNNFNKKISTLIAKQI